MTQEEIRHFQTLGFLHYKQFLSPDETATPSSAFDAAMERARKDALAPKAGEPRQQVIPFFDYDPDVFYPLLDDDRIMGVFESVAFVHWQKRSPTSNSKNTSARTAHNFWP